MMGCCGIFKPNRITQFCMGYSGLSDCKGMFPFKKNKRNTIDSKHSFSAVADLSFSRWNCARFKWFRTYRDLCTFQSKRAIIFETLSIILYVFLPLLSPPMAAHRVSSRKRLQHNSRYRGWGPYLGDIASLIPLSSRARSSPLPAVPLTNGIQKTLPLPWVSGMFNYLVKAQKRIWVSQDQSVYHWRDLGSYL